ncbi:MULTISPECIES: Arc family DNA-binding protein [Morganellaceae]|uniref:Arc family DNA-binding protein n=1 Tax=Morganellaceae TaxID=1903414 RepID=UPI0016553BEA|nr:MULTISPECIES: Arc family DNA-binding protein [Morganellaceae]MBC8655085.1 Arc family DNA-binding protein [Providencia vermicola]ELR5054694.1 Arc family DNA-binding protein [Providencia rettgeri]ELR5156762.1 Arc family DNA-binding protein [Providencia rettgeri]ELR5183846.1 Arc family DNA-binding protein [Providencia rettgeri]ELR5266788.1 Arc family DNA-binding protein [Providencia rettgeri]
MDEIYTQRATERYNLRMPKRVKDSLEKKAREEGLSLNSAIIQRLVWSLNNDKNIA